MTPEGRAEAEQALGAARRAAIGQRPIIQQMEAGRRAQATREEILRKSPGAEAELARHQAIAAGARNRQIAGADRLAMSRRDDARARQVEGSQTLGRWIATIDHPTQGLIEVPVSAPSREGAAQSAAFTVGGVLQNLRPHDDTARQIEKRSKK
jgi:hypothetical protein